MKKWKVGDQGWSANFGNRQKEIKCPVCFGKRQVTVILGDDSNVVVPCKYCDNGYEGPRGYVTEYEYCKDVKPVTIDKITTEESSDGADQYCMDGHYGYYPDKTLFRTKEEAEIVATERAKQYKRDQDTRAIHIKKEQNKTYTWNAGYHMREAKRDRASAERHEQQAIICKERAK